MTIGLLIVVTALASRAASGTGSLESSPGIHVVSFRLPAGTIYVNLPGDLAAGDTGSATVNPVPAGMTERDQARQRQELSGYSLALGGQRAPAAAGVRTFAVATGANHFIITLFDPRGRPAGEVEAPLRSPSPPAASYVIPSLGQGGGRCESPAPSMATSPIRRCRSAASPRNPWPNPHASSSCAARRRELRRHPSR